MEGFIPVKEVEGFITVKEVERFITELKILVDKKMGATGSFSQAKIDFQAMEAMLDRVNVKLTDLKSANDKSPKSDWEINRWCIMKEDLEAVRYDLKHGYIPFAIVVRYPEEKKTTVQEESETPEPETDEE